MCYAAQGLSVGTKNGSTTPQCTPLGTVRLSLLPVLCGRFIQIVAGSKGMVESFTCGPSKISRLQQKLEEYGLKPAEERDFPEFTDVSKLLDE